MASDEDHRPCLPLKPQEKKFNYLSSKKVDYFLAIIQSDSVWKLVF
jgi:hypothetical protein